MSPLKMHPREECALKMLSGTGVVEEALAAGWRTEIDLVVVVCAVVCTLSLSFGCLQLNIYRLFTRINNE